MSDIKKMELPLISVIVPIYNVEKYVRKCLESLKNQTLRRIEIICIDDGSTDESGKIADEYESSEFPIFRVFHTENRGLSAARNRGIDEAQAEWLMFVDSDDWVSEDYCGVPWKAKEEYKADLVIFEACWIEKNGKVRSSNKSKASNGIVDEFTAHESGWVNAWNKFYKKELFTCIHYPEGRVFEDIAVTHKLIHAAKTIVKLPNILYHHIDRFGSISHTNTAVNKRDKFVSSLERRNDLILYGYPINELIMYQAAIGYLSTVASSDDLLFIEARRIIDSIEGIPKALTMKQKIALCAWKADSRLFYILCTISRRIRV